MFISSEKANQKPYRHRPIIAYKQQQHNQCNPMSGYGEGSVYAALPLPCKGRKVVSETPSAQVKNTKSIRKRNSNHK